MEVPTRDALCFANSILRSVHCFVEISLGRALVTGRWRLVIGYLQNAQ
jgi:hypothetical protein